MEFLKVDFGVAFNPRELLVEFFFVAPSNFSQEAVAVPAASRFDLLDPPALTSGLSIIEFLRAQGEDVGRCKGQKPAEKNSTSITSH